MQKDAERCQALVTRNTCRKTLSPQYVQTHAATLSALNVCRHMLQHARLSKSENTRRYTLGSWYVRTQAHTLSSLDAANQIKTSTQPSKCADRCTDTLSSRGASARRRKLNEDTRSALVTCKLTLSSRDSIRSAHGDTRSALETCQQRGTCRQHTFSTWRYTLSSRNMPTNKAHADDKPSAHGDTPSTLDTGNWMKIHAQLSKHANKCSALEPHMQTNAQLKMQAN